MAPTSKFFHTVSRRHTSITLVVADLLCMKCLILNLGFQYLQLTLLICRSHEAGSEYPPVGFSWVCPDHRETKGWGHPKQQNGGPEDGPFSNNSQTRLGGGIEYL